MAISDFKEMVENARKLKGYSQRELAKMIGMSQSTYNDTINGKIKKPDIDILKILLAFQNLLICPKIDRVCGLGNIYAAKLWKEDKAKYDSIAKEYTENYASW